MSFSIKYNPWSKTLQWISETASVAWGSITGMPAAISGTQEAFTTVLKNKLDNITSPLLWKGGITISSDFPTLAGVQTGWTYTILADVTDNDATKTNTGLVFLQNAEIAWNGSTWISFGYSSVKSVAGKTGIVTLTSGDVGLGNVDNKSEATIITDVKSDSDISSAISLKHASGSDAETTTTIGSLINGAIEKTNPVDADYFSYMDSQASNILKKISSLNLKAFFKAYFDTIYTLSNLGGISSTSPVLGGEMNAGAHSIGFTEQAITSSSGTATINWRNSNKAKLTLSENVTTSTWTAPSYPCSLLLKVIQDSTPRTISWPTAVKWAGGSAPTLTATSGARDIIAMYWDGSYYYAVATQNFVVS